MGKKDIHNRLSCLKVIVVTVIIIAVLFCLGACGNQESHSFLDDYEAGDYNSDYQPSEASKMTLEAHLKENGVDSESWTKQQQEINEEMGIDDAEKILVTIKDNTITFDIYFLLEDVAPSNITKETWDQQEEIQKEIFEEDFLPAYIEPFEDVKGKVKVKYNYYIDNSKYDKEFLHSFEFKA